MKLALSCLLFMTFGLSAATTRYVTTGGNDTTGDGSVGNPYATATKAATVAVAGDTINVAAGMYQERVTVPTGGTAGNPITYLGTSATNRGFLINSKNYITIQGFSVNNTNLMATNNFNSANASGIYVVNSHDINIISNYCYQCGQAGIRINSSYSAPPVSHDCLVQGNVSVSNVVSGMYISGTNITVLQNEVSWIFQVSQAYIDNGWYRTNFSLSLDSDGILWYGSGLYFASNNVHDLYYGATGPGGSNYWYDPHTDGFQGDNFQGMGTPSNCVFNANLLNVPSQNGAAFYGQNMTNILWMNNIAKCHRGPSINTGESLTFVNNTIMDDMADPTANPAALGFTSVNLLTIQNNILFNNPVQQIVLVTCANVTSGKNMEYTGSALATDSGYDSTRRLADYWGTNPVMIAQSDPFFPANYKLATNSPAIGNGITSASVTNDFANVSRPQEGTYDIGAFEFQPSSAHPINVNRAFVGRITAAP